MTVENSELQQIDRALEQARQAADLETLRTSVVTALEMLKKQAEASAAFG
jgi:hypothetical protein